MCVEEGRWSEKGEEWGYGSFGQTVPCEGPRRQPTPPTRYMILEEIDQQLAQGL